VAGGASRRRGIVAEINVTPLVDIMLVLLITFMLTAHIVQQKQAIAVDLPRASQSSAVPPTTITVTLTRDGALFLNGAAVTPDQLRSAVKDALLKDPKTQAIISLAIKRFRMAASCGCSIPSKCLASARLRFKSIHQKWWHR
jgi:biopolymer transport protein TolR